MGDRRRTADYEPVMAAALDLAARGRLRVEPNPPVGAVVLDPEGRVVGEGFHAAYGGPHAEAVALSEAGGRARGGTVVVTLEPCAHEGKKTPPCVPALVAAGVARVVAGVADPNAQTSGRARDALAAAGIEYLEGVLEDRCGELLGRYVAHLDSDLPWVIAKWAMSADGRIADLRGASRWITGERSRELVHDLRGRVEALIVGRGTIVADDPSLDCRLPGRPSPMRVILDTALRTPLTSKVVRTARDLPTVVFGAAESDDPARRDALVGCGVRVETVASGPDGCVDPLAALRRLHALGVRRVLLEAGGELTSAFVRAGATHQVMAFTAPVLLGGDAAPHPLAGPGFALYAAPRLVGTRVTALGEDSLLEGYLDAAR